MVNVRRALADTSVFIGIEATRFDPDRFAGYEWGVSVVTLGELRLGVLQASGPEAAARRLSTYQLAQRFEPLGIDEAVSKHGHYWCPSCAPPNCACRSTTAGLRPQPWRTALRS